MPQMESTKVGPVGDDSSDEIDQRGNPADVVADDVSAESEHEADDSESEEEADDDESEEESDDDEGGTEAAINAADKTIPTSADEIVENLFRISDEGEETVVKQKKYSLRYWMAVIIARWPKLTEREIEQKFGISRSTIKKHLSESPRECMYIPRLRAKSKYAPCTAEKIVDHLCIPDAELNPSEETYALRFWVSVVVLKWQKIGRTQLQLQKLLGISQTKISKGANARLLPASQGYLAV